MNNEKWLDEINKKVEQARRDYKGPHCCLTMQRGLENNTNIFVYDPEFREYGVKIPKSTGYIGIDYCMFCGKKLPTSLRREWHDILEEKYGLDSPDDRDRKKVPKEFLSDEWWKKRNL